jgi:hypothetical protein
MSIDSFKKEQRILRWAGALTLFFAFSVIETWRPVASKPSAELRRYFIGGTPELDNILYCGNCADGR